MYNAKMLERLIALARRHGSDIKVGYSHSTYPAVTPEQIEWVQVIQGIKGATGDPMSPDVAFGKLLSAKVSGEFGPVIIHTSIEKAPERVDDPEEPANVVKVFFSNGIEKTLFQYYPDEISYSSMDLWGLTEEEAIERHSRMDNDFQNAKHSSANADAQVKFKSAISRISADLANQDNLGTTDPLYLVKQIAYVYGVGPGYTDKFTWFDRDNNAAYGKLKALLEEGDPSDVRRVGYTRVGYKEVEEYVTACFTRAGAERYIFENAHNLERPFVYVDTLNHNHEMIAVRQLLRSDWQDQNPILAEKQNGPSRQDLVQMINSLASALNDQAIALDDNPTFGAGEDAELAGLAARGLALIKNESIMLSTVSTSQFAINESRNHQRPGCSN